MDFSKKRFFLPAIVIFWLLIGILNISQTYLSSYVRGWTFVWSEQLIYAVSWILWILYTPLIFLLVGKNPIQQTIDWKFLRKNILIALGFALVHCAIDITLQYSLWNLIVGKKMLMEFYGSFYYKYHVNVFIFLFVAGASYTVDYLRRSRQLEVEKANLEALLNEAKLASLKTRLQPHFLFNTHHNIVALMMKGENDTAITMLTKLSDLLRKTLDLGDQQFVPLKEEIGIVETYLAIHKIRFSDRLQINMEIDQVLMDEDFPLMLLQPLVENALQHGISKSSSAGQLDIKIIKNGTYIDVSVQDDGPGCPEMTREGIGLKTTKSRLDFLYPNNNFMKTKNVSPNGFLVQIEFPLNRDTNER